MDKEKILKPAIIKAKKNGWTALDYDSQIHKLYIDEYSACLIRKETGTYDLELSVNDIIFSHDFAKAFFHCKHELEEYESGSFIERCKICGQQKMIGMKFDNWEYHLQEIVLEKNPLKYIRKYL